MNTDTELAILGISEVASHALLSAMLKNSDVEVIRAEVEKSVYWPEFCRAVAAGYDPEDKLPGAIGRCVGGWAKDTNMGVAWWNAMTPLERSQAFDAAHTDIPHVAWRHWQKHNRRAA